jgi:hypothetical protein
MNIDGRKWFEINGLLLPNYLPISQFQNNKKGNGLYGTKCFFIFWYTIACIHLVVGCGNWVWRKVFTLLVLGMFFLTHINMLQTTPKFVFHN